MMGYYTPHCKGRATRYKVVMVRERTYKIITCIPKRLHSTDMRHDSKYMHSTTHLKSKYKNDSHFIERKPGMP